MVKGLTIKDLLRITLDKPAKAKKGQEPEPQTFWLFEPLDLDDDAWLTDLEYTHGGNIPLGTVSLKFLRKRLRGVENFFDQHGNAIEFEKAGKDAEHPEGPSDAFIRRIPRDTRALTVLRLIRANRLSEDEAEKS